MVDKFLKALLLLSPIVYASVIPLNLFDALFFRIASIALFIVSLFDSPKRSINISKLAGSLILLCGFNLFIHNFNPVVLSNFINLFFGIIILWVIVNYADKNIRNYYKYIISAGIINIFVFLFQKVGFNPILSTTPIGFEGGIIGNSTRFATYLALLFPVIWGYNWVFGLLTIIISLMTKQYILLAVGIAILFIVLKKRRFKNIALLLCISVILLLHKEIYHPLFIRISVWGKVIEEICKRPLLGYGIGNLEFLMKDTKVWYTTVNCAFNDYLQFIYGVGVLGIAWIVFYFRKFYKSFQYTLENLSLLGVMIILFLEYPLEIPRLWITIISILGFYLIKRKENGKIC